MGRRRGDHKKNLQLPKESNKRTPQSKFSALFSLPTQETPRPYVPLSRALSNDQFNPSLNKTKPNQKFKKQIGKLK